MSKHAPTYIWRKLVSGDWLAAHEPSVQEITAGLHAVIARAGKQRLLVEMACGQAQARELERAFGGRSEKLSRDWLNEMLRAKKSKPIRAGQRLVVVGDEEGAPPEALIIPAGAAFGTGEHATTAMSLRMLERVTRRFEPGWRMLDAGTGSGILALAGKRFGAGEVIAVENNPLALATAKQNGRLNRLRGVLFIEDDVEAHLRDKFDLIAANLYSTLLIELLPRFHRALAADGLLVLSGVMRAQERELLRALVAARLEMREIRRRGKWIALLAARKRG